LKGVNNLGRIKGGVKYFASLEGGVKVLAFGGIKHLWVESKRLRVESKALREELRHL
jgi:hypothetical protein